MSNTPQFPNHITDDAATAIFLAEFNALLARAKTTHNISSTGTAVGILTIAAQALTLVNLDATRSFLACLAALMDDSATPDERQASEQDMERALRRLYYSKPLADNAGQ